MKRNFMFTSESVTEGHPDKLCDQISDAFVDHYLKQDSRSRIIAECAVSTSVLFIAARFASRNANIDFPSVARKVIREIGYDTEEFNSQTCSILTSLQEMPTDGYGDFDELSLTDKEIEEIPVENQVNVFGYACNQTPVLMPLPIWLANRLARQLVAATRGGDIYNLGLDGKTQVGVEFKDRMPHRIHSMTIMAGRKHRGENDDEALYKAVRKAVIDKVFDDEPLKPDKDTKIFINPEGPVFLGGPSIHSGLTGRKNAIDTYGEFSRHSGAALSGKDPLRIDRVGAYAARYAAKNIVSAGLAEECELQVTYAIGRSRPVSLMVETFGSGKLPDEEIIGIVDEHFDFRIAGIIKQFRLRHLPAERKGGFYQRLAAYGHVGRDDLDLPWEKADMAETLRKHASR
jgi:S-adenosylmethionine synthetase